MPEHFVVCPPRKGKETLNLCLLLLCPNAENWDGNLIFGHLAERWLRVVICRAPASTETHTTLPVYCVVLQMQSCISSSLISYAFYYLLSGIKGKRSI